jgi:hypothetical protein
MRHDLQAKKEMPSNKDAKMSDTSKQLDPRTHAHTHTHTHTHTVSIYLWWLVSGDVTVSSQTE